MLRNISTALGLNAHVALPNVALFLCFAYRRMSQMRRVVEKHVDGSSF